MNAADFGTALSALGTQISGYVPAILALLGVGLGIRVGIKWFRRGANAAT